LSNAFLGSYVSLENKKAHDESIFEHWPTMFLNVEQWQTHQFSTFFSTTPLAIWAYTNSLPLEVDLY
jgi:hypothetical protein